MNLFYFNNVVEAPIDVLTNQKIRMNKIPSKEDVVRFELDQMEDEEEIGKIIEPQSATKMQIPKVKTNKKKN